MIVSKCFVAARDRFDGGDVAWLLRALQEQLDWPRIEWLMREHWQILYWQLIHFLYVFPGEGRALPPDLMRRLGRRVERELEGGSDDPRVCRGPMLDPKLYRLELERRGSEDPRPRRELVEPRLIELHGRAGADGHDG
jgi:hypothetical protein